MRTWGKGRTRPSMWLGGFFENKGRGWFPRRRQGRRGHIPSEDVYRDGGGGQNIFLGGRNSHLSLVAPYCAIPRDYLSDTPLLRAMRLLVSQHGQFGAMPLPLFWAFPPWRACEVEVRYPPTQKGYLSDTCAKTRQNGCDAPLCDTISKRDCAIGGVSRTGSQIPTCVKD